MSKKPNFLYIITDQHRADYLGCYGHPLLRTPNIDSIAEKGSRFEEFYVASPVCMPNRASLMTGRFPSVHGLRKNGLYLSQSATTFADVLREGGYDTGMIGKSHVQPFSGQELTQQNPYADAALPEAMKAADEDWLQEDPSRWIGEEPYHVTTPYYGFDHVEMVTKHGDKAGGHYYQWLREQVGSPEAIRGPANQLEHDYVCPQAMRTAVPEELHPTSYIRDRAVEYLSDDERKDKPFFAFVSFPDPHHPFSPPGKYWDMYDPDDFEVGLPYEAHNNPPPHFRYIREQYLAGERNASTEKAFMASDQEIREAMALTCGMITMIDDAVGVLLQTLKEQGLDENTIVVFNTDHGDHMGDFNLLLKGPAPTKSVTRVPFIWYDPQQKTLPVVNSLCSTVDIAPTIIERAGLAPYNGIQGASLLPLLDNDRSKRTSLLVEHEDNIPHWGFSEPAHSRTLITRNHRLTVYSENSWGELYDLLSDPDETHNLWDEPDSFKVRATLTTLLLRKVISAGETSPCPKLLA